MARPLLLDLFCGAGGCTRGYTMAGFDCVGVDIAPQPRYALSGGIEFHRDDALAFVAKHGREFDLIHASPPCQNYSAMRCLPWLKDREYWDSIPPTREAMLTTGRPYVIENVERAPMLNGIILCGATFGLKVYRHRKFESNVLLLAPPHHKHTHVIGGGRMLNDRAKPSDDGWVSLSGKSSGGRSGYVGRDGWCTVTGDLKSPAFYDAAQAAMGINWMSRNELSQAIPPAFTFHVGSQLLAALAANAEAAA